VIGQAPPHDGSTKTEEPTVGAEVNRLADHLAGLLRDTSDLVRLTLREELAEMMRKAVALAAAGIALFLGLLFLGNSLALYVGRTVGRAGGFLIVAIAFVVVGFVMALSATKDGRKS
jgi:uncharacterized membrane protein YqjE